MPKHQVENEEVEVTKSEGKLLPRKSRVNKDGGPGYHCDNCKCDRYNPCRCVKKN